ncbi:hypothetical protein [Novosphingobium ginsenosidimutans]|uniref:Alpha/beta hydrolase n=1 Tax=Novosphingobium ginsenosidimutans TaxID=1176536 RepID=A0A5B8S408_9SPHN|nr:hypothetical protein [Novosphingobium ginsenosidimutans]QEA15868.1 hypothetical protein FRF71_06765 [Novosphingobium ginsenosidimutans]
MVRENSRSPFKARSEIVVAAPGCVTRSGKTGFCQYRMSASDGLRVVGISNSSDLFIVHDDEKWISRIKFSNNELPEVIEKRSVKIHDFENVSNFNITNETSVDSFVAQVLKTKMEIADTINSDQSIFAFHFKYSTRSFIISDNGNLRLSFVFNKLYRSDLSETDIYDLNMDIDQLQSAGLKLTAKGPDLQIIDRPFKTAAGFEDFFVDQSILLRSGSDAFARSVKGGQTTDSWGPSNRETTSASCYREARSPYEVKSFVHEGLPIKVIVPINRRRSAKLVVYFFGGPSGQFFNSFPGPIIEEMLRDGRIVVVPYTSGSVGAGSETSRRLVRLGLRAFETDAQKFQRFLLKYFNRYSYDVVGVSFGAVPAVSTSQFNAAKPDKIILVAPFTKLLRPDIYRSTERAILYQTRLERSWFGDLSNRRDETINPWLKDLYSRLAASGVNYYLVLRSVDQISPPSNISDFVAGQAKGIKVLKADHELVTVHPDTIEFVSQKLHE